MWLSLVEYLNGVQVAAGSNPVTPTTSRQAFVACRILFAQNTAALFRLPLLFRKKSNDFLRVFLFFKVRFAPLLLLFPKSLSTFWEPCACGAFFLLKPLSLAAASERTLLRSDFCLHKKSVTRSVIPPLSQKVYRLFGSPVFIRFY